LEVEIVNGQDTENDGGSVGSAYPRAEGPVSHGWFSLGQGRGIKWTLWKTSVTFQRQEKQGDKWIALEELHVAPKVLKEMVWRIPGWLETVEQSDEGVGNK